MPGDIHERFLRHAVEAERDVGRHGPERVVRPKRHRQAMLAFELAAVTPERGSQADVLQDARMELVRQVPDRLR